MSGLETLNRHVTAIEEAAASFAGTALFAVMVVVFSDVGLRYLFNAPLPWSYDFIGMYLLPALFFPIIADTFRRNHHVALDILYLRFPITLQRAVRLLAALAGMGAFAIIAWRVSLKAASAFAAGEVVGGSILWPTWIPLSVSALGFCLIVVRLCVDALALVIALLLNSREVAGESPDRAAVPDEAMKSPT